MKEQNKTLKVLKGSSKVSSSRKEKLLTIKDRIFDSLKVQIKQIVYLSYGRIGDLSNRFKVTKNFFELVLKIKKNHGADYTIKGLKCCYVSLQKSLGGDNLSSMRELEPLLPLPRLINGIPSIIGSNDRKLIREGHKGTIIYWSSIFSVYRVLKCSYKLKTSSITDPFSGDTHGMSALLENERFNIHFDKLNGYQKLVTEFNIAPQKIRLLRAASPSQKVSGHGLLHDSLRIFKDWKQLTIITDYLDSIESLGGNTSGFGGKYEEMVTLATRLDYFSALGNKPSYTGGIGQFSLKEEAAGKLRIFALVDIISQNLLSPLHDFMFALLKRIPNDGTFDQDLSVKRSQSKALVSGKAFSFDLSSATDRLPVDLTVKILSGIFNKDFADAGKRLMTDRDFHFSPHAIKNFQAPASLRYSVGQPMGALSSGPSLALTHHGILQHCSKIIGRTGGEENYEILGDDLVVFDEALAFKYLEVARQLGVEINLSKSISSYNRPVFEFAKRTIVGELNVSPIPFRQLMSNDKVSDRVMNFMTFLNRGLLKSRGLMGVVLSKFGDGKILNKKDQIKTPLLSILGVLYHKNIIPHRWLIEALIDPVKDLDSLREFTLPQERVIKLIKDVGKKFSGELEELTYPFSNEEDRKEIFMDYKPEFANVIANTAYTRAKALERDLPELVTSNSRHLYRDPESGVMFDSSNQPKNIDPTLVDAVEGGFDNLLYCDGKFDVSDLVDSIESNDAFYYRQLDLETSLEIERQVDQHLFNFDLTPKEHNQVVNESAPVIKTISKVLGGKTSGYGQIERPS